MADGEWHQLALTCNALTRVFQLYHNGTLAATYSDWANPMLHNTSGGLTIGGGLGLESVAGKVDEVQFAHSILTAAQITQICKEGFLVIIR